MVENINSLGYGGTKWVKLLNTLIFDGMRYRVFTSVYSGICLDKLDQIDPFILAHYKYVFAVLGEGYITLTQLVCVDNVGNVYSNTLPLEASVMSTQ